MLCFNGDYKPISAENFIKWQRRGIIRVDRSTDTSKPLHLPVSVVELPWILKKDIASRGKACVLLKGIACAQIGWLLVQYIARRVQSLATSSLEALTVAYIICALFSYAAWWKKLYDLELPMATDVCPEHEVASLLEDKPSSISMIDDPDLPLLLDVLWTYIIPCTAAV